MAKFSIKRDILGGQFLKGFATQWLFILYIIFLIIFYIGITTLVQEAQLNFAKNEIELKNLKADYTCRVAKLLNSSSREQIKDKLRECGSTLKSPTKPAYVISDTEQ